MLLLPSPHFSPFADFFSYFCLLLILGMALLCFAHALAADEMTVGKVYAALMIFDFYKQNKNSREQVQPPGGLCQVQKGVFPPSLLGSFNKNHQQDSSRRPGCSSRQGFKILAQKWKSLLKVSLKKYF